MAPNKRHMFGANYTSSVVDKRRAVSTAGDGESHYTSRSIAAFTANGAGSTTTIVGANAAPGTNDNNVIRRGDEIQLFTAAGAKKEETVFSITGVAVAGSTTVTFTPAAAVATASGDVARVVSRRDLDSIQSMQDRLVGLGRSDSDINNMTANDMEFAIRYADNQDSI